MKILLAVDGSSYSQRMLDYIAAHPELLGPSHDYTLCTVVAAIPANASRFLDRVTLDSYYADEAGRTLQPLSGFTKRPGWRVLATHVVGHAAEAIAGLAAAQKHDLIVMGARGHSSLVNIILGSVTTGVLARCTMPVLLIR